MKLVRQQWFYGLSSILLLVGCAKKIIDPVVREPNILLIVADDAGYSDIGCYGGEIPTPNIDRLAGEGTRFTAFHAEPNCSPSRAAMLSGADCHFAGMGAMGLLRTENQLGKPGYEGHLTDRVETMAEALRSRGYFTCMAGKWHLGHAAGQLPVDRGFDRSFSMLSGGASHWADNAPLIPGHPGVYIEDAQLIETLPLDFYSSKNYADKIIEYTNPEKEKPFFAYLAFTAPHNPLHAPDEYIAHHKGRYDGGWEELQAERFERMKTMGIIAPDMVPSSLPDWLLDWDALTPDQQKFRSRDMEIFAAMVEYLDMSVGRVIAHLKKTGQYENTLIIFMSDNGSSRSTIQDYIALGGETADFFNQFDNSFENKGRPGSSSDIGPAWAWACSTPHRLTKGYLSQGGIQVPFILKMPKGMSNDGMSDAPLHVSDIKSMVLGAAPPEKNRVLCFEFYGMRAVRQGEWKALHLPEPYGNDTWQLYNLEDDPAEQHDLSAQFPDLMKELSTEWEVYAKRNGIILPDKKVGYTKPPRNGAF